MAIIRSFTNANKIVDHRGVVIDTDILYGALNASSLFEEKNTSAETVAFTRNKSLHTMLPTVDRVGGKPSVGTDRTSKVHAIPLPYWKHSEALTARDTKDQVDWETLEGPLAQAKAKARKISDIQIRAEQTKEYMKLEAIKGVTLDPEGNTLFDAFTEFGQAQVTVDLDLAATTSLNIKFDLLIRTIAANNRTGQNISAPVVLCGNNLFTKITTHADMEAYYSGFANSGGPQLNRDSLFTWTDWGVTGEFFHKGIKFINYEPSFIKPDGTSVSPIGTDDGYVILPNHRDLYLGYNGPSEKFSRANMPGAAMFLHEWTLPKDEGLEIEMEMSPLFIMTNPLLSVKVTSSTGMA